MLFPLFFLGACQKKEVNPPAEGFNLTGSDEKAIAIADGVMEACGGRTNWDKTRYLSWVFAGNRKHVWDKQTGDIRIESKKDSTVYLMNIQTMQGRVRQNASEVTDTAALSALLKKAYGMWVNDSYWLVMPFKMKDTGVTLKYIGESKTTDERPADVVAMTFEKVGVTPKNKYHIFVDKESKLITEWSFYSDASVDTVNFTLPWKNYQKYGGLLLSGDRERLQLTEISVDETPPDGVFTEFDL